MALKVSRTRLLSIGVIAAIGLLSTAWTFSQPLAFRASAVLQVGREAQSPFTVEGTDAPATGRTMLLNDVATLANSDGVLEEAARSAGLEDPDGYRVGTEVDADAATVTVNVTGPDPDAVKRLANEIAEGVPKAARDIQLAAAGHIKLERQATRVEPA